MPSPRSLVSLAALLLAVPAIAKAQDLRYGLTAGITAPMADLKDYNDKPTLHVGGFADWKLNSSFTLRPRVDIIALEQEKKNWEYWTDATGARSAEFKRNVYGVSGGVDVLYTLPVSVKGLYATAGLGIQSLKTETLYEGLKYTETATKPVISIGAGYDVNEHWGVSAKYVASKFKVNTPYKTYTDDPTASGAQVSVHYKF